MNPRLRMLAAVNGLIFPKLHLASVVEVEQLTVCMLARRGSRVGEQIQPVLQAENPSLYIRAVPVLQISRVSACEEGDSAALQHRTVDVTERSAGTPGVRKVHIFPAVRHKRIVRVNAL